MHEGQVPAQKIIKILLAEPPLKNLKRLVRQKAGDILDPQTIAEVIEPVARSFEFWSGTIRSFLLGMITSIISCGAERSVDKERVIMKLICN